MAVVTVRYRSISVLQTIRERQGDRSRSPFLFHERRRGRERDRGKGRVEEVLIPTTLFDLLVIGEQKRALSPSSEMKGKEKEKETLSPILNQPAFTTRDPRLRDTINRESSPIQKWTSNEWEYGWGEKSAECVDPPPITVPPLKRDEKMEERNNEEGIRSQSPTGSHGISFNSSNSRLEKSHCNTVLRPMLDSTPSRSTLHDYVSLCFALKFNRDYESIIDYYERMRAIVRVVRTPSIGRDGCCVLKFKGEFETKLALDRRSVTFCDEPMRLSYPGLIKYSIDSDEIDMKRLEHELDRYFGAVAEISV
ncbi:hypothetical protein PENTCL1PPCAC_27012, partial [Pristionchus entomophagus]